jgi:hypothetical protein
MTIGRCKRQQKSPQISLGAFSVANLFKGIFLFFVMPAKAGIQFS